MKSFFLYLFFAFTFEAGIINSAHHTGILWYLATLCCMIPGLILIMEGINASLLEGKLQKIERLENAIKILNSMQDDSIAPTL